MKKTFRTYLLLALAFLSCLMSGTIAAYADEAEEGAVGDVEEVGGEYVEANVLIWDDGTGQIFFTDFDERPLSGEWRIEGVDYVLDAGGAIVAGGGPAGSKGRLYVPARGIDVAVNVAHDDNAQYFTDLEDSAAYMRYALSKYYIADHNNQAFEGLLSAEVGDEAYLFTPAGIEAFVCTDILYGHNIEYGLTDEDDDDIVGRVPLDGFIAYTCLDSWVNVRITFWERTWIASTDSPASEVHLQRRDARTTPMESATSPIELESRIGIPLLSIARPGAPSLRAFRQPAEQRVEFAGLQQFCDGVASAAVPTPAEAARALLPDLAQFDELLRSRLAARAGGAL